MPLALASPQLASCAAPPPRRNTQSLHNHWRAGSLGRLGLHWTGNASDVIVTARLPCGQFSRTTWGPRRLCLLLLLRPLHLLSRLHCCRCRAALHLHAAAEQLCTCTCACTRTSAHTAPPTPPTPATPCSCDEAGWGNYIKANGPALGLQLEPYTFLTFIYPTRATGCTSGGYAYGRTAFAAASWSSLVYPLVHEVRGVVGSVGVGGGVWGVWGCVMGVVRGGGGCRVGCVYSGGGGGCDRGRVGIGVVG